MVFILRGTSDEQLYSLRHFVRDGGKDPGATVLVQENGVWNLIQNPVIHGPSPTFGKKRLKGPVHKLETKREAQGLVARLSGLCLTHRGAEREDLAL